MDSHVLNPSILTDAELVDRLGLAKASAAVAAQNEKMFADELKRRHAGGAQLSGVMFDASVARVEGRETWDSQWLREHLHANQLRHALKHGDAFLTVKVTARRKEAA